MASSLRHQVAAMWHTLRGRHHDALAHHHATLAEDPAHWSALFFVLKELRREGRDAEALAVAERALRAEPSHFLALQTAACLSIKLGRHAEGRHYVERGLQALPIVRAGSTPVADRIYVVALRAAQLLRGRRAVSDPREPLSLTTARYLKDWKEWAEGYVAWHDATTAEANTVRGNERAIEQADAADEAQGGTRTAS